MTLLWMDGFDHYNQDNELQDKGYDFNGLYQTLGAYGRFGSGGLRVSSETNGYLRKDLGVNKSTLYVGFAIKDASILELEYDVNAPFLQFEDENGLTQVNLHFTGTSAVRANNSAGTQLGISSSSVVPPKQWFHFEVKVTISDTVGEVTANINGNQVLNLTSQDTKNVSDYIRKVVLNGIALSSIAIETRYDDYWIDDAQFHGDCRVKTFLPDSDSTTHTDFVRSTGSNDYECVDESPPNDDTDYIYANVAADKSTFGFSTGTLRTVEGIQVNNYARKDDAGDRTIRPIVRSNGADYNGTTKDLSAQYLFFNDIWETDPDDAGVWTQTKLEAAEFGLEIVA